MSRGDCGDLLKVSVTCTAYKQTQTLLLKVMAMLKVTKFHISDHNEFLKSNGVEVWLVFSLW